MSVADLLRHWLRGHPVVRTDPGDVPPPAVQRAPVDHVIVLDGTLASLRPGHESNAGRAYQLFCERLPGTPRRSLYYEPGLQWEGWGDTLDVLQGRGINRQIRRAYGHLASHYRPGDRIYLFGYSRGAYAVRSLAGVIDRVGLLRHDMATERNVVLAYRHYEHAPDSASARAFAEAFCHAQTPIQMIGVWDTVKALGVRLPLLWKLTEGRHAFHNHHLGRNVLHGFHALALHETRDAYAPVLWDCPDDWQANVEQVWFRGAHGDIGGQLGDFEAARPLANIPLVWMLAHAESCGLILPQGWRHRFPCDPKAPIVGATRGLRAAFLLRSPRRIGQDRSEHIHPSAVEAEPDRWLPKPRPRPRRA